MEAKVLSFQSVKGKHARIDRIILGNKTKIFGEVPNARAMSFVGGDPKFFIDF